MMKRKAPPLTEAQERAIQAEIAADPEAAEATDAELAQMRPASEVLPPALFAALTGRTDAHAVSDQVSVTLRLDRRLVDAYRATGPGWQRRMRAALAEGIERAKA